MKTRSRILFALLWQCAIASVSAEGIPPSEWTPMEQSFVAQARDAYARQGLPFTDDQASVAVRNMRARIAGITGQIGALQLLAGGRAPMPETGGFDPRALAVTIDETRLGERVAAFPEPSARARITGRRDGFDVDGRPFLDAEGSITMHAHSMRTGYITYAARAGSGYVIKTWRVGSDMEPVTIARATLSANGWDVQTETGKRLAGAALTMAPLGFMVAREASAFRYVPGKGVEAIAVPDGYVLASMQRGDIGGTGFVLLEREQATGARGDSAGQLLSTFKALGSSLGMTRKEDYALMDTRDGRLFPLNVSAEGKLVNRYADCVKRNRLVNECASVHSFASLYDNMGMRNNRHYYWRVQWLASDVGPVAISHENGVRDVVITDLTTGKRVTAFSRGLGIVGFDVEQDISGVIRLSADWSFQKHEIPDVLAYLANPPEADEAMRVANEDKGAAGSGAWDAAW